MEYHPSKFSLQIFTEPLHRLVIYYNGKDDFTINDIDGYDLVPLSEEDCEKLANKPLDIFIRLNYGILTSFKETIDINYLNRFKNIKSLEISNIFNVESTGFDEVNLPNLEYLSLGIEDKYLNFQNIKKAGINILDRLPKLKQFDFGSPNTTNFINTRTRSEKLQALTFNGVFDKTDFTKIPNLKYLWCFSRKKEFNESINDIKLKGLKIQGVKSLEQLEFLKYQNELDSINLAMGVIDTIPYISESLTCFQLQNNGYIMNFSKLMDTNIEYLSLNLPYEFNYNLVCALEKMKHLKNISIESPIKNTDNIIEKLTDCFGEKLHYKFDDIKRHWIKVFDLDGKSKIVYNEYDKYETN